MLYNLVQVFFDLKISAANIMFYHVFFNAVNLHNTFSDYIFEIFMYLKVFSFLFQVSVQLFTMPLSHPLIVNGKKNCKQVFSY